MAARADVPRAGKVGPRSNPGPYFFKEGGQMTAIMSSEIQVLAKAAGAAPAVRSEIEQVVALDAVVVVVNKQNPVGALNLCQIAEIFAGRIRNWRELGGRPGAINLQVRLGRLAPSRRFRRSF
jgi:ABC-type phosphate transport system substrate-binding protein